MRSPTRNFPLNIYMLNRNHSFSSISIDRNYGKFAARRWFKHKMENKLNFRLFSSLSLLTLHGDINQLANFVSVNQTQNATISTTKSNRINHSRTFSIVNKLVRQFCVYVILCHLDDDAIVIDI